MRDGRYKFIAAPRRELYDTQTDPGETRDLSASNPRLADALETALRDMAARTAAATAQTPRPMDPEVEERLRALGYVGATVTQGRAGRPIPRRSEGQDRPLQPAEARRQTIRSPAGSTMGSPKSVRCLLPTPR